ncbi:UNVERIFIED_CONTAM: hypothetical protein Slati_1431800 [Sesamum latifolium]|uniref:RNase H type-1 domain-containing protein n=1 Tax=Sesamum latifolium TaxID=2727402 RepID=A0AAW2X678_9LAMI
MSWTKLCESKHSGGMGFRDLEAFNLALVSKQVWRILKNPDTLLSKIYFARGSIFEAKLGFNPSSDGSNIRIWLDQWLPRPYSFRPIQTQDCSLWNTKVETLIDKDHHCWKEDIIDRTFVPDDASLIKALPLARHGVQDVLFNWLGSAQNWLRFLYDNLDAAIFKVQVGAGLSAVIRNDEGECLRWQSKFVKHITDPTHAEALAARMAIEMALEFPGRTIEVEGDCLVVVNDINKRDWIHSYVGPIIKDICVLLDHYTNVTVKFSRRSANKVAHALARRAVEVNGSNFPPDTSNTILQRDMEPNE